MKFGEKLRMLRTQQKFTQAEVAGTIGVTLRTYQNYETGGLYPKKSEIYGKLAKLFQVTADYLLSDQEEYFAEAAIKGGTKAKREVQTLLSQLGGMFAGGELSEDDKDKVMKTINDLYWDAKEKNKKYTPKKYRNSKPE